MDLSDVLYLAKENNCMRDNISTLSLQFYHRYCEDESDSDDEVDWESLVKAVRKFQRQNG